MERMALEFKGTDDIPPDVLKEMVEAERQKAMVGLIAGFVLIVFGAVLVVMGATGNIGWNIEIGGISSQLTNASPGALLMIVGFLVIWTTRFEVAVVHEKAKRRAKKA